MKINTRFGKELEHSEISQGSCFRVLKLETHAFGRETRYLSLLIPFFPIK